MELYVRIALISTIRSAELERPSPAYQRLCDMKQNCDLGLTVFVFKGGGHGTVRVY